MNISIAQLRSLLARAHSRQEERNIRLAREIHDDVSQKLTALSIELSLLQRRLGSHPEAAKTGELLELVGGISASVRKAMNDLRPKVLDEFGLVAAIKYECQRRQKAQRRAISFSSSPGDVELPAPQASEVFRLFQEVFSYVLEQKSDAEVRVNLVKERSRLCIAVECSAFTAGKNGEHKMTLLQIQEHAQRLGGQMTVSRKGTSGLTLLLPLPKKKA